MDDQKPDAMEWLRRVGVLSHISHDPVGDDDLIRIDFGNDDVVVEANRNGFRALASMMAMFDHDDVPDGDHMHCYPGIQLAHDSLNLLVAQVWPNEREAELCAGLPPLITKNDKAEVVFRPDSQPCLNVDLVYNEVEITGNRRGFRVLATTLEEFAKDRIQISEALRLDPGVHLARHSTPLTLALTDETWIEHCALCLGHQPQEIASKRALDEPARAAWEHFVIQEIEAYWAENGPIELPMPPKVGR
jgi:hypothetical protein